jgi:hypothetical protein
MTKVNGHLDMTSKSNKPLNKTTNISLLSMFPSYQKHKIFHPSICFFPPCVELALIEERKEKRVLDDVQTVLVVFVDSYAASAEEVSISFSPSSSFCSQDLSYSSTG